jgi:hypothetical protein
VVPPIHPTTAFTTTTAATTARPTYALPPVPDHCLLLLTTPQFSISKPVGERCELAVIALTDHCWLELTFTQFYLADSPGCLSEYLEIDGQRYCGHQPAGVTGKFLIGVKELRGQCREIFDLQFFFIKQSSLGP